MTAEAKAFNKIGSSLFKLWFGRLSLLINVFEFNFNYVR